VALALAKGARLSAIARSGRVRLRVTADEAASVELDGTLRVASRTYSLTGARRDVAAARKTVLSLKLPDGARLAAAKAKSARVRISAGARDAAGNRGSSSLRRKLRR
jgi:hypothetical protein